MADTKLDTTFREIKPDRIDNGIPVYEHEIDQFEWYTNMIGKTMSNPDGEGYYNPKLFLSSVRFHLPYTMGKDIATPPTFLVIVGDGHSVVDGYFARVWESYQLGMHITEACYNRIEHHQRYGTYFLIVMKELMLT